MADIVLIEADGAKRNPCKVPASHEPVIVAASDIVISDGISVRAGHHCAQPLLNYLGVSAATRASFMFYNTEEEADAFVKSIASIRERMGYGK